MKLKVVILGLLAFVLSFNALASDVGVAYEFKGLNYSYKTQSPNLKLRTKFRPNMSLVHANFNADLTRRFAIGAGYKTDIFGNSSQIKEFNDISNDLYSTTGGDASYNEFYGYISTRITDYWKFKIKGDYSRVKQGPTLSDVTTSRYISFDNDNYNLSAIFDLGLVYQYFDYGIGLGGILGRSDTKSTLQDSSDVVKTRFKAWNIGYTVNPYFIVNFTRSLQLGLFYDFKYTVDISTDDASLTQNGTPNSNVEVKTNNQIDNSVMLRLSYKF